MGTLVSCNSTVSACVQSLQWHLALGLFEMPDGVDLITWLWQHGGEGGGVWAWLYFWCDGFDVGRTSRKNTSYGLASSRKMKQDASECWCLKDVWAKISKPICFPFMEYHSTIIQLSFHMWAFRSPYPSAEQQVMRSSLSSPLGQRNTRRPRIT